MSHWDSCNAIERRPDKVSGAWIFENIRLPVATLFEALKTALPSTSSWTTSKASRASRS